MAALAAGLSIGSLVVSQLGPLVIPKIISLFQQAHPAPADATPAVKADLNSLKASGALKMLTVLADQLATAGKLGVSATDPAVQSELKGAIEATYQTMKAAGILDASTPDPLAALTPGAATPPNTSGGLPTTPGAQPATAPTAAPKQAALTTTLASGGRVTITVT
jgi:hypothetical protein